MPNVMFEWHQSSKPAFTVRALFVQLSWHGLNIIHIIWSTIHQFNYNEVKLMGNVDCDNKWWIFPLPIFHIQTNMWVHTEEYWKISKRKIKLKINLLIGPVHGYEMDSNKPIKWLILYYMLLLGKNYFFASNTSSLHWRHKLYQKWYRFVTPHQYLKDSSRYFLLVCIGAMRTFPFRTCHRLWFLCLVACSGGIAFGFHC